MACVMAVGGWMVSEYMNMDEVVAMVLDGPRSARFHRFASAGRRYSRSRSRD